MKNIVVFLIFMLFSFNSNSSNNTFHDFEIQSIEGNNILTSKFKGKVVLLVNTASKCGFTPHYEGLQRLYDRFKEDGLVVLGIPSNDFNQELSNDKQVKEFCEIRYGVNFPMTKISNVRGDNAHPIYKWISENVSMIGNPKWNFHKYLIGKNGNLINWYSSMTSPLSDSLIKEIETALY